MMKNPIIEQLIKPEILQLSSYHVPNSEGLLKLDAMENPYPLPEEVQSALIHAIQQQSIEVNRYPEPNAPALKQRLFDAFQIDSTQYDILLGNGSDELLQLIIMAIAKPNATVMSIEPSFVMYKMICQFLGVNYIGIPLNEDFSLDTKTCIDAIQTHQPAVIFLAYPNNPTGNLFKYDDVISIINASKGLVVIDEAYHAFANASFLTSLDQYADKVIVLRTLSKLGLAGLRLGYLIGSPAWIQELDKIRLPYNINVLTQKLAEIALTHIESYNRQTDILKQERSNLINALNQNNNLIVYPSSANFVLIRLNESFNATEIFTTLRDQYKILIKNLSTGHALLKNCLRLTVGTPEQNLLLINALNKIVK